MTDILSMVSHKNYNLNANEGGFVIFLTSKLITCFIDGVTSNIKSQSIAYLLNGSERIYWILDIEDEVYSIWVIWTINFQECKGNFVIKVVQSGQQFAVMILKFWIFVEVARRCQITGPNPYPPSLKFVGGMASAMPIAKTKFGIFYILAFL